MTDLIVVPQQTQWQKLKALVLDSVSSPITKRVYNLGLDEFFAWFGQEPRPGFTKATVSAWRVALGGPRSRLDLDQQDSDSPTQPVGPNARSSYAPIERGKSCAFSDHDRCFASWPVV